VQPLSDKTADDWFAGPLGAHVLREEAALAQVALDDVFGFELLQVGTWGSSQTLLESARTQHTTVLAPEWTPGVTLRAPLASLPFSSDSIDAILLPHTLELVEDPYAVLREAERVLCADGCLLICGFNPFSGWGARRLFGRYFRRPAFPPQTRRMLAERRLRDWMALLDFEVASVYGYLGPMPVTRRPRKMARNTPRKMALKMDDDSIRQAEYRARRALLSGAYLLKARKRVQTLTLVRPRRRSRQLVLVPAAEPTTKVGSNKLGSDDPHS